MKNVLREASQNDKRRIVEEHEYADANASTSTYDALVLDARLRQSLMTVRSLGSRGLRIAALGKKDCAPTFSSRWCQRAYVCPADEGADAYLSYLEAMLDKNAVRVVIPSSDGTIELLRRHRELIERRVRIAIAKESALAIAVNKQQTLDVAKQLGLNVPRGVVVSSVDQVKEALNEIGLPAVIKPIESWVSMEHQGIRVVSQLVTTLNEAQLVVEQLMSLGGGAVLFQQFLSGRREAVSFLYAQGRTYARFAQWAKRTVPPLGGQSVLRQSISVPDDIGPQAERLIQSIELEGYSEVEFRRDSAGIPYLMEINPRLSASVEIAIRSGVDFPHLLYQWANQEEIDSVKHYHTGNWMRYLKGDISTTVAALRQRGRPGVPPPAQSLLDFVLSFFTPTRYDYLDWRDPLPALVATRGFVVRVSQIMSKRLVTRKSR